MDVDRRAIIAQSVRNVVLIFNDIDAILQMTDDWMTKRNGLWSIYGNVVTWDTTARLGGSSLWLYQWFGRGYSRKDRPNRVVGLTVHLPEEWSAPMTRLGIELPVINVSRLDLDTDVRKLDARRVLDALWDAGWNRIIRVHEVVQSRLVRCTMRVADHTAEAVTYFVDFLSLVNGEAVERLVIEPMWHMWQDEPEWVVRQRLEVIELTAAPAPSAHEDAVQQGTGSGE